MFGKKSEERIGREAEERNMNFEREQRSLSNEPEYEEVQQRDVLRQDLLKWQQDLNDELENLKNDLRRKKYDPQKQEWVDQEMIVGYTEENVPVKEILPPLLNEIGITKIEIISRSLLSRNLVNSNLSEQNIRSILKRTSDVLVNDLAQNYRFYDSHFSDLSFIIRLIKNVIIPTPYRALGGWNKRIDSTMNKRIESFNEGFKKEQPKKFLGLFGG